MLAKIDITDTPAFITAAFLRFHFLPLAASRFSPILAGRQAFVMTAAAQVATFSPQDAAELSRRFLRYFFASPFIVSHATGQLLRH